MGKTNDQFVDVITRRQFLGGTVCGALGLALGFGVENPLVWAEENAPFAAENPVSRLIMVRDEAAVSSDHVPNLEVTSKMIDRAILALSGEKDVLKAWGKYFRKDDTVGVKITRCQWMRIGTEEVVVQAIVKRLKDVGITEDHIIAKDFGIPLEKCTALINAPAVKVHTLTGIAAVLKNYINFADNPRDYHHEDSAKMGEIWHLPHVEGKTRLVILDMLRPYFGPGPQINPAHRWDYKGIIVGTDPVAVEAAALSICQKKRNLFKGEDWPITPPPVLIHAAEEKYKLGISDPRKIKLTRLGWEKETLI